jgi:hypothetical protein
MATQLQNNDDAKEGMLAFDAGTKKAFLLYKTTEKKNERQK